MGDSELVKAQLFSCVGDHRYSPLAHGSLASNVSLEAARHHNYGVLPQERRSHSSSGCDVLQEDVEVVKPHYQGKSTAQIAYKWVLQHDVSICTLPFSSSENLRGIRRLRLHVYTQLVVSILVVCWRASRLVGG